MSVLDELAWRGLLQDSTEGARDHLDEPRTVYIGFDPTADSLHVGSLERDLVQHSLEQGSQPAGTDILGG